ncbi:MAG: hypothetical protein C4B58_04860 [Deltaproteobacteria bacterium]|nr:MAG: hypothetical protein C4B58_04860 [Deltaproteobacteria bacterium]
MINDLHSSKTLIIGTGSGRDIAACILMREYLRKICQSVDVAGFLTPWAFHSFNDEIEKPVNLPSKKCTKFILLDFGHF